MQIENNNKNKAALEDVRLGLRFRNIRPTVRTVMQEFNLGQRKATEILHDLVQEGVLLQDPETRRFRMKPHDDAIEKTALEIRELTRLTLARYAERARKRELS